MNNKHKGSDFVFTIKYKFHTLDIWGNNEFETGRVKANDAAHVKMLIGIYILGFRFKNLSLFKK